MPESENQFIPPEASEAQNEQVNIVFEDTVAESGESGKERIVQGILRKIDKIWQKHPKLSKLVLTLAVVADLAGVADYVARQSHPKVGEQIVLPNIQRRADVVEYNEFEKTAKSYPDVEPWRVYEIMNADAVSSPAERDEVRELPRNFRVNGFEKFDISNETVERILRETLPKGFLRNINSISYRDYHQAMPSTYGMNLVESTRQAAHADSSEKSIEIIRGAKGANISWVANELIVHESFHLQDWRANSLLTADERLELFKGVAARVKSPDRYKSNYVEDIKNNDKHLELESKSAEYFAEIGAAYMSSKYKQLPKPDRELLDGFIKKMDPKFDRVKALKKRRELIGEPPPYS